MPVFVLPRRPPTPAAETIDRIVHQIVTNDQKQDLTDAQRARGIQQMIDAGLSVTKVAKIHRTKRQRRHQHRFAIRSRYRHHSGADPRRERSSDDLPVKRAQLERLPSAMIAWRNQVLADELLSPLRAVRRPAPEAQRLGGDSGYSSCWKHVSSCPEMST